MTVNEKTIEVFATRTRQLILQYQDLKKENAELYVMVDDLESRIRALESKLSQAESEYNSLKMAKMIEITDTDMESAKKRLSQLIRDVNKCITLLSEQS